MDLKKEISKDLKIDRTKLGEEAIINIQLIQKYIDIYIKELKKLTIKKIEFEELRGQKIIYYKHEHKILPETIKELEAFLSSDEDIIKIKPELEAQELLVTYLKEVVENFKSRGFAIKDAISWQKFTEGVD